MDLSRISRRIVVAIFVVFILCLTCLNIMLVLKGVDSSSTALKLAKYAFPFVILILTVGYAYIKEKMYKLKINRRIALTYRYAYVAIILIASSIYNLYGTILNAPSFGFWLCVLISCTVAIVIKKIIFNVSKSDILSVIAAFTYILLPNIITNKAEYVISMLATLFCAVAIFFMQKLIDELKQQGIKNKKYIVYTLISAIFIGLTLVFGIEIYSYIPLIILFLLITSNLDMTHITFSKRILDKLSLDKKELLYRVERMNINKLIVSIIIMAIIVVILLIVFNLIFININIENEYLSQLNKHQNYIDRLVLRGYSFDNISQNAVRLLESSNIFYLVAFIYLIGVEILTLILKRRYDTKSTALKILFMSVVLLFLLSVSSVFFYHNIFVLFVILIAIVNTSNIYLNRDERIKLLKA